MSAVWLVFDKETFCCQWCKAGKFKDCNRSGMRRHIKDKHSQRFAKEHPEHYRSLTAKKKRQQPLSFTSTTTTKPLTMDTPEGYAIGVKIFRAIVDAKLPFHKLRAQGPLQRLFTVLASPVTLTRRYASDVMLQNVWCKFLQHMQGLFRTVAGVGLTTDIWSSRQNHSYLGITAHWIDDNAVVRMHTASLCCCSALLQ